MDQGNQDDVSSMIESVEISASELTCTSSVPNSVQDTHHEPVHAVENVCSVSHQSRYVEQMDLSKNDASVFEKPLSRTTLDPALLPVTRFEDYSDVSSCSEADFDILNGSEKNPDQSSECQTVGCRDENEFEKAFCPAERPNAWAANDEATENQNYVYSASPETKGEGQSGSFGNVLEADNQIERSSLNPEYQCSNLTTATGENVCPLKTEEQMKGVLKQNTDYGVAERSKNCRHTLATPEQNSVCALDLNATKQNIQDDETNAISTGDVGAQDCTLKGINNICEIKNNTAEYEVKYGVKNTAHKNEAENDGTRNSQDVEHGSFEFLQSCFGLNSVVHTKLEQNTETFLVNENMIQDSQNCKVAHVQPPVLERPISESVPTDHIREVADDGLQEPHITRTFSTTSVSQDLEQPNDLAGPESTYNTEIKNSVTLSSKKLMRKLQPVVLLKTTKHNAKDGNMYACSVCKKNTLNLDELIEHHHGNHSKHTFQYCLTCGGYFSNGTLAAQHLCGQIRPRDMEPSEILSTSKQLTEKLDAKYQCKYCQKPFVKKSYYQDHEERHRTVTPHRCDRCGLYFSHAKRVYAHKRKVRCTPLILEPNEPRKKCSVTALKNAAKSDFTIGNCSGQIGLPDCFVKLVDINKESSPQKVNCPVCGKKFKLRAQLKVHFRSHTDAKPFKCKKCKKVFKYLWNLDRHKRELCSGDITKPHFSEPPITGTGFDKFACPTCPQVFRYSYNRTRHMRQRCLQVYMQTGKGKVGNRYKCPLCKETFSLSANRNRHIKNTCFQQYKTRRHTDKRNLFKGSIKKEEEQVVSIENFPCYKCKVCPASFSHKSGVYRHMKKHSLLQASAVPVTNSDNVTEVKESDSNIEIPQSQQDSDEKSSDMESSTPLLCRFCDKCFSSTDVLKSHLQLHGQKKPFRCLDCGKNFKRRGHLIVHKNVHKRRIQCSVCKKILPTIGDLLIHRQSHIKKGTLQCPDCPMQFKFPVYLLRHVASHAKKEAVAKSYLPAEAPSKKPADEKVKEFIERFKCGICQKGFVDSKSMSKHCLTHLPTGSKCPVCKHNFTSRTALIRHVRLHTGEKPFPCNICGMHFHRKEPLRVHQEKCKVFQEKSLTPLSTTRTREKSTKVKAASKPEKNPKKYFCSYCPHIFTRSGNWKLHEKAHMGSNLVPCSKCGKYFKRNKIYGHRKHCNSKESTSRENFNSEKTGNAHKSEHTDTNVIVTNRTCRVAKELGTSIKEKFKECCPHCSKRFQFRSYLLRHLHTHLGKKTFACKHCGQKYDSQSSCQQHETLCDGMLSKHEAKQLKESEETKVMPDSAASLKDCTVIIGANGEQLKCNFCTKTFTKPRNLRRHILTHTEVKPYRCKTCENSFSRYDHLKYHQTRCRGKKQQLEVHFEQITADHVASQIKRQAQSEEFECSTCLKKFSTQSNLTRHLSMLHSTFKPFSCKRCGTRFTCKDSLKRHHIRVNCKVSLAECPEPVKMPTNVNTPVQTCRETSKLVQRIEVHYSNKWKFQCEYCPRRFKNQTQLKVHTRLHTGEKPFGCAGCNERFIRRDYLKRHLTKCRGKTDDPKVLCDRCGGLFTQDMLEMHQKSCIISLKSTECPVGGSSISTPSKVKAFSCVNCNDRFLLFSQLQQHIFAKHKTDELQQSEFLKYDQLSSHVHVKEEPVDDSYAGNLQRSGQIYEKYGHGNGEREKPFECVECNTRFITASGLSMHMRTHAALYTRVCKKCNKGFWNKIVQQKHTRKCKGLEPAENETNKKDTVSSELEGTPNEKVLVFNKGSNTTGTGVLQTKFSCKDQNKGNADKEEAVVHKYQCSECEQSFTDGLMLISHLEAHGREDQERKLGKSHSCHICGKTFDQAGTLQRHVKTQHQEPAKNTCPECFRSFRYPSDLDLHRSCHDPNRPFVCGTCNSRFWTSKSLSAHQRISHSTSEPLKTIESTVKTDGMSPKVFTCHPCNKIYTVKGSYLKHLRVKHKGYSKSLDVKSATTKQQLSSSDSDGSDADDKDVGDDDSDSAPYFPCHVCGKTFVTSESLEDHQRCHLGEKPHECEECGKCFIQLVNLQQHQRSHKSEFQCQMCGKGFVSLFALRKHKHTHVRKRPHRCTKCHLSFTRSSQLTEHMTTHRDENFPCDLCHENFSCKSSRAEHRKIHAEEELPPLIPPAKQTSSLPISYNSLSGTVQQYRYRCEICQVRFPDPEQLSEHGCNPAKERPYSCKDCNKHFLHGSHLKKHQLTHQLSGARSFQCNSCHMSFSHRHHFLTHLQTHGGEDSSKPQMDDEGKISNTDDFNQDKIYKCPICPESFSQVLELANHLSVHANMCNVCNKTFSTKQQLEKHEQSHLSAATQYECTECGKSFLGSDAFRQHYCVHQKHSLENSEVLTNNEEEDVDVGEDFYNCSTCNKRFPSNISLQEHQKLHELDRPFKCLVCGKGFTKKKYLTKHQQTHNERAHQCDLCSSIFKTKQSLLSHHKTHDSHRKYQCSVCGKSFKTSYDLSKHEQKHPKLQTFSEASGDHRCDMCYKSFNMLSQLRQHQETHVGQVVYECTECDKAFAFLHLLEEHQQTHRTSPDSFSSQSPTDFLFQSPIIE